jgi:hypothetical protein
MASFAMAGHKQIDVSGLRLRTALDNHASQSIAVTSEKSDVWWGHG